MITKAIIVEMITPYQAKVRIPIYNKAVTSSTATPDKNLPIATICTYPGISPGYVVGDVVFVDFEENVVSQPVILGLLYRVDTENSVSDITVSNLFMNDKSHLYDLSPQTITTEQIDSLQDIL